MEKKKDAEQILLNSDDDEDYDYKENESQLKTEDGKFLDIVGDVKKKLDKNCLNYVRKELHPGRATDELYVNNTRFDVLYKDFKEET